MSVSYTHLTSAVANNTNVGATSASSTPEGMVTVRELLSQLTEDNSSVNDLASLKKYLDSDECTCLLYTSYSSLLANSGGSLA